MGEDLPYEARGWCGALAVVWAAVARARGRGGGGGCRLQAAGCRLQAAGCRVGRQQAWNPMLRAESMSGWGDEWRREGAAAREWRTNTESNPSAEGRPHAL